MKTTPEPQSCRRTQAHGLRTHLVPGARSQPRAQGQPRARNQPGAQNQPRAQIHPGAQSQPVVPVPSLRSYPITLVPSPRSYPVALVLSPRSHPGALEPIIWHRPKSSTSWARGLYQVPHSLFLYERDRPLSRPPSPSRPTESSTISAKSKTTLAVPALIPVTFRLHCLPSGRCAALRPSMNTRRMALPCYYSGTTKKLSKTRRPSLTRLQSRQPV